ncbi:MAG: DUF1622 domain-containing protein [Clostridia bacterium]|nr:DUF1622 domain-containing protein [Clostridia bacterium]
MLEAAESVLDIVIQYSVLILEIIGALIILYHVVRAVIDLFTGKARLCRAAITEGITTGLSFLLVSEVLKTIIDRDWTSIGMTCAILLMRASISLLVHWESKAEAEHE